MRRVDGAERVVTVLDLLSRAPEGLGVSDIARELDVHRSTVSRLLGTLASSGLVERDPVTRRFRLGTRILGLAATAMARLPVVSQARPLLEELASVTSETANLAVLDRFHVVYVDQIAPAQTVVMRSWVGRRSPAHASSSGKVIMAFGDRRIREAVLRRPLEALTEHTMTDPSALRHQLDEVRSRGYATSRGELALDLISIAAPVRLDGQAVAAVSISGPPRRFPSGDLPRLAHAVVDAGAAIGHRLAGRTITTRPSPA